MPNEEKSLKFEITINKNNDKGIPKVIMSAEVIMGDGTSKKIGTDIFLLSENSDNSQKILKGRVGQSAAEMFIYYMT